MTQMTESEIKTVYFALIFMAIFGVFMYFYNQQPIQHTYNTSSIVDNTQTSVSTEKTWISNLIGDLPTPFNDPIVILLSGIIVFPVIVMLTYISIRAIKDLISQWL